MKDFYERCKKCEKAFVYIEKNSAYYCLWCDEWGETKCECPKCEYCLQKPDKPEGM